MTEKQQVIQVTQLALEVSEFVQKLAGELSSSPEVTEALYLSMQLLGGPHRTTQVLTYCGFKVS